MVSGGYSLNRQKAQACNTGRLSRDWHLPRVCFAVLGGPTSPKRSDNCKYLCLSLKTSVPMPLMTTEAVLRLLATKRLAYSTNYAVQ